MRPASEAGGIDHPVHRILQRLATNRWPHPAQAHLIAHPLSIHPGAGRQGGHQRRRIGTILHLQPGGTAVLRRVDGLIQPETHVLGGNPPHPQRTPQRAQRALPAGRPPAIMGRRTRRHLQHHAAAVAIILARGQIIVDLQPHLRGCCRPAPPGPGRILPRFRRRRWTRPGHQNIRGRPRLAAGLDGISPAHRIIHPMDAWPFVLGLRRFLVRGVGLQHRPRIAKRIGARHRPIGIVPERHQHATRSPLRLAARGWQAPLQRRAGYRQRPLKRKPRCNDRGRLCRLKTGRGSVHRSGRGQPQPCQHRPGGHTASAILDPGSLQAVPSDHHHLRFRACK